MVTTSHYLEIQQSNIPQIVEPVNVFLGSGTEQLRSPLLPPMLRPMKTLPSASVVQDTLPQLSKIHTSGLFSYDSITNDTEDTLSPSSKVGDTGDKVSDRSLSRELQSGSMLYTAVTPYEILCTEPECKRHFKRREHHY
jgi:hypothetical protein